MGREGTTGPSKERGGRAGGPREVARCRDGARRGSGQRQPRSSQTRRRAAGGIAAKYAAKLAAKRGDGAPAAPTPGDADLLSSAKALVEAADAQRNNEESSRWRMGPPGLKGLLTHASRRSMALAVVARPDTSPRELADLTSQAGVAFDVVVDGDDALDAAVDALGLAPHRVLAFVDDAALLSQAKAPRLAHGAVRGRRRGAPGPPRPAAGLRRVGLRRRRRRHRRVERAVVPRRFCYVVSPKVCQIMGLEEGKEGAYADSRAIRRFRSTRFCSRS